MKKSKNILLTLFALAMIMSCEEKKISSECVNHYSCDDEYVTHIYKEEIGTVQKFVISPVHNPDNFIYILIDHDNEVLVPCPGLPDSLSVDGLSVQFSGFKTNCCRLIAKENWRIGIGCKFDLIQIKKSQI